VHVAAGEPERLARAHTAAVRVNVMLLVARAWGHMPDAACLHICQSFVDGR
jgi:hypothetical protein